MIGCPGTGCPLSRAAVADGRRRRPGGDHDSPPLGDDALDVFQMALGDDDVGAVEHPGVPLHLPRKAPQGVSIALDLVADHLLTQGDDVTTNLAAHPHLLDDERVRGQVLQQGATDVGVKHQRPR